MSGLEDRAWAGRLSPRVSRLPWALSGFLLLAGSLGVLFSRPLNLDTSFVYAVAFRLLDGADLYTDIIEPNTPFIYHFSLLPAMLTRLLRTDPVRTWQWFMVGHVALALWLCRRAMERLPLFEDFLLRQATLVVLLYLLFVTPQTSMWQFGQREHLFLAFLAPYLLSAAAQVQGRPPGRLEGLLVGFLAGFGLALKPFFVLTWVAVEAYLALRRRPFKPWRRPENLAILVVLVLEHGYLLLGERDYLEVARLFLAIHGKVVWNYYDLLTNIWAWPCLWAAGLALALRADEAEAPVRHVWLLAGGTSFLYLVVYLKGFPYHYYPPLAAAGFILTVGLGRKGFRLESLRGGPTGLAVALLAGLTVHGLVMLERNPFSYFHRTTWAVADLIREQAHAQKVYQLAFCNDPLFPAIIYGQGKWAGHFANLLLIGAGYASTAHQPPPQVYHRPEEMDEVEKFAFETVIGDLLTYPPRLLLVDRRPCQRLVGCRGFDYLDYFGQDGRFRRFFQKYRLIKEIDGFGVYVGPD